MGSSAWFLRRWTADGSVFPGSGGRRTPRDEATGPHAWGGHLQWDREAESMAVTSITVAICMAPHGYVDKEEPSITIGFRVLRMSVRENED